MRKLSTALATVAMFVASTLALHAQSFSVRGTIQEFGSAFGTRPLAGATVRLSPGGLSAVSDANGAYIIASVPSGTYSLRASAPGHQTLDTRVTVNSDMVLNYVLQVQEAARVTLSGTVTESGSFGTRPLQGATVKLSPGEFTTTTNSSGYYSFSNVPSGTYTLAVSAAGHASSTRALTLRTSSTVNVNLRVVDDAARVMMSGTVTESGSFGTRPLAGATVRLEPGDHTATTNSSGYYSMSNIPTGTYTLSVSSAGHHSSTRAVTLRANTTMNINLRVRTSDEPPASDDDGDRDDVTGIIRGADGDGVSGVSLRLTPGNYQATTDANGRFRFPNVPSGRYMLHIRGGGVHTTNRKVTIGSDRTLDITVGAARGRGNDDRIDGRGDDDDDDDDDGRIERRDDDDDDDADRIDRSSSDKDSKGKGKAKGKEKNKGKGNGGSKGKGNGRSK